MADARGSMQAHTAHL